MKQLKRIKKFYNLSWKLAASGFIFWGAETLIFLIWYGWHKEPINDFEAACDIISKVLLYGGWISFIYSVANVVSVFSTCVDVTLNNEPIEDANK